MLPFGLRPGRFAFREPAEDAWLNFIIGSVRSSKTWSLIPKILMLCRYPVAGLKLMTGVTKQSIYLNVLNDLFEIVGERNYSYNRQSGELTLFGTKWFVMGAKDEGSEKYLRGSTVGIGVCDEVVLMPKSFFDMLLSRLSPDGARLYGSTNTGSPHHWFKKEILDSPKLRPGLGADIWHETWTMDDNPNLSPAFVEKMKRSYTGVFYKRFILGLWVTAEGSIYADSLGDDTWYTDEDRPIGLLSQHGSEHIIACDYGTTNPCTFGEYHDDGLTIWKEREYYWDSKVTLRQKTDSEYADDLVEFINSGARGKLDPSEWPQIIVDPSAASFKVELISRGIAVIDADNEVSDGIRRTSTMLSRRRLRIHERCVNTRRELESYAWNPKAALVGVEEPLKQNDHAVDELRYLVETKVGDWRLAA